MLLTFADGGVHARDHLYVANFSCPTGRAYAFVLVAVLNAGCLIHARVRSAPVYVLFTVASGVAVRAVARIVFYVVDAGGSVRARIRIAFVDSGLTVASRVPANKCERFYNGLRTSCRTIVRELL